MHRTLEKDKGKIKHPVLLIVTPSLQETTLKVFS